MTKQQISRSELCSRVLAELRQQPGCEGVKEIAITIEHIAGEPTTWHVSIVDDGDASPALLLTKARSLQEEWSEIFEVVEDK